MLFAVPDELSAYQKAQLDSILKFTDVTTHAVEQWFDLNAKTAKAATLEAVKQFRALAEAKDVPELASLQASFAQGNSEKATGFVRASQSWATETHSELTKLLEAEVAEINKSLAATVDKAAKAAPSGSEFAFNAIRQALTTSNQAYDALAKAGKQVVEMTEATLAASADGVLGGRKKTPTAAAA